MGIGLVWEVRGTFPEGRWVKLRSEIQQVTRHRGRRRPGQAAGLVGGGKAFGLCPSSSRKT